MVKGHGNNLPPVLKAFIPVVEALGKTLGRHCELVLHDIARKESSIIAIENGHITNRSVGSPSTDFLLDLLNQFERNGNEMELNYVTKSKEGKRLKSSTILIRDEEDKIAGALCINIDLTSIDMAQNFLDEIARVEDKAETTEQFPEDARDFLVVMVNNSLEQINKPASLLNKEEKLQIVSYLDQNNIFNIKGAVDLLAETLNVSRYTIYNYLDEVRASNSGLHD
ncbi:MAG: PAS domain-containing protein [Halanaerobium sp.]|nr:PAS domain-containing protein [Halanaerobium sp.]